MIHAYNEQFLGTTMDKLAEMFELAVDVEGLDIDEFAQLFLNSRLCRAFEKADPVYVYGRSSNELLAMILGKEPVDIATSSIATPEYWAGWVLAYSQWYLNRPYAELLAALPCSKLLERYFPYHEMDVTDSVELFRDRLPKEIALKRLRRQLSLSQLELAALSGVPERTIRSYEQGKVDISKAQAETLFALSEVLRCTIEELIE